MKAVVWTKYGSPDHLQLREMPKPAPADTEILIQVHATTATAADTEFRRLKLPLLYSVPLRLYLGFTKPTRITILGTEFSGEVVETGKLASRWKPGDQVFGYTGLRMGAYAEYICLPEKPATLGCVIAQKPSNISFAEAAALPFGGLEALHALKKADIRSGQTILIVGAGGSIGTYAVQLAKYYGAEVTGVDKPGKLEMLREIGAAQVIDYTRQDYWKSGQVYDVIFDTIGKGSFSGSLRSLKENGTYLNANPGLLGRMRMRRAVQPGNRRLIPWSAGYSTANLDALAKLVEAGILRAVIDRRYPLEQAAEAHRYVETGQKKGNVVITVSDRYR